MRPFAVPMIGLWGSDGIDPDTQAYITAAGITDTTWIAALDVFFKATPAIRAKLDGLWLWANQSVTAARTDAINPARALLGFQNYSGYYDSDGDGEVDTYSEATPLFTQWRGYTQQTFDGSNYTALTTPLNFGSLKFGANGHSFGTYQNVGIIGSSIAVPLNASVNSQAVGFRIDGQNNQLNARFGYTGSPAAVGLAGAKTGLLAVSTTESGAYRFSRNGVAIGENSSGTQAVLTQTSTVQFGGGPGSRAAAMYLGARLSDAETLALYDAFQALFTIIGAQI